MASRGGRKMKGIYSRLKKAPEPQALPVMVHGDKLSTELHGATERIINPRLSRVKTMIQSLKLSAAYSGSYSLSANQIGMPFSIFVLHKELKDKTSSAFLEQMWLHPEAIKLQEEQPIPDPEEISLAVSNKLLLQPSDFETVLNPRVISQTSHEIIDWEYCLSFPGIRCMVKRPQGVVVNFLDEKGEEQEEKLFDFSARVFLHEVDHVNGRTMTHWRLSEGNIDVVKGKEDRNKHLMTTVNFYKDKIAEMKSQFDEDLFEEKRPFSERTEPDGDTWRDFKHSTRQQTIQDVIPEKTMAPAFEETMLVDTIRAMRRDRKQLAKDMNRAKRSNRAATPEDPSSD